MCRLSPQRRADSEGPDPKRRSPATYANPNLHPKSLTLKVCVLNEVCANNDELFSLERGDEFRCRFDQAMYDEMARVLVESDVR